MILLLWVRCELLLPGLGACTACTTWWRRRTEKRSTWLGRCKAIPRFGKMRSDQPEVEDKTLLTINNETKNKLEVYFYRVWMWRGIVVSTTGCYARGPAFKSCKTQTFLRKTTSLFFLNSVYNCFHVLLFVRCVISIYVVNLWFSVIAVIHNELPFLCNACIWDQINYIIIIMSAKLKKMF